MGPLLTLRQICNSAGLPNTYETPVDADVIDVDRKRSEHVMDAIITVPMEEEKSIYKNIDVMVMHPLVKAISRSCRKEDLFCLKSLTAEDTGVLVKEKHYCNWSARQRMSTMPMIIPIFPAWSSLAHV